MNKSIGLIAVTGIGAGLMYLFDPDRGKRRRARLRDTVEHAAHKTKLAAETTSRDVANRLTGVVSGVKSLVSCEQVDDDVLVSRVRSKLGRVVSHPGSIKVEASDGNVVLTGAILTEEIDNLIEAVSSVRGVTAVESRLEPHAQADIPGLQQGRPHPGELTALMQQNWSPTARLLAGLGGGALLSYGVRNPNLVGVAAGGAGLCLVARAATNLKLRRLVGLRDNHRAIDTQKTINIAAPVQQVFEFWMHHEAFPSFMKNVREVRDLGNGRYHWTVAGPAGLSVEWDAEITKLVPNQLLAWQSLPGQLIDQAGIIHFHRNDDDTTCVDIKLSYNPPAGAIGHALAKMFGVDPKSEMDEDLMRMKSFIETGHLPHDAAQKAAGRAAGQHSGD